MTAAQTKSRLLVVLATFNERANLKALVDEILGVVPYADILVIDDNSPDGTGQLADHLASADGRIHVHHRPKKLGLGTAVSFAVEYALKRQYEFFLTMDADFSHNPQHISRLLDRRNEFDIVIGSRYVAGGSTGNWSRLRCFISGMVNSVVRFFMKIPARDTSGGFRCYRSASIRRVDMTLVQSHGYSIQEELLWRCFRTGCTIGEVPITFENRRGGESKVSLAEITRSMGMILRLGLKALLGSRT